jgi:hypothetical protein
MFLRLIAWTRAARAGFVSASSSGLFARVKIAFWKRFHIATTSGAASILGPYVKQSLFPSSPNPYGETHTHPHPVHEREGVVIIITVGRRERIILYHLSSSLMSKSNPF